MSTQRSCLLKVWRIISFRKLCIYILFLLKYEFDFQNIDSICDLKDFYLFIFLYNKFLFYWQNRSYFDNIS